MREAIGPVAAFRNSVSVTALPRTRSGKTARKSIADMAAGRKVQVSGNLELFANIFLHSTELFSKKCLK